MPVTHLGLSLKLTLCSDHHGQVVMKMGALQHTPAGAPAGANAKSASSLISAPRQDKLTTLCNILWHTWASYQRCQPL
jgi:hypothetical protein